MFNENYTVIKRFLLLLFVYGAVNFDYAEGMTWPPTTPPPTTAPTSPSMTVWTTTSPSMTVWTTTTPPATTTVWTTTTALTTIVPGTTTISSPTLTDHDFAKLLTKDFLSDIDERIIPVNNKSNPIQIKTAFVPVSLIEFDTTNQKFSMLGYMRVVWYEETISWDEDDYGGIKHMIVPSTTVWRPTITIHKAYNGKGLVGNKLTDQIRIGQTGHIQWVPKGTYSVVCDVDIRYYPFDEQICKIVYYAADESIDRVELNHNDEVLMRSLNKNENAAWKIHKVERNKFIRSNNYHIEIIFYLSRRPNYAMYTLIVPLLMLSALNVCMFLVPIESGEKGGFAITIFLSYGIYISILSDKLPHNSLQTSFFIVFLTLLLVFSVVSVLYSVIEAKLVVSIGAKHCLLGCFCSQNKCKPGNDSNETTKKSKTWSDVFRKLDIIIFVVYVILILVISITFFCMMARQISKDKD
ncbi:Neuronal acetylcholine receptor subunit [Mactra antiquata]